MVPAIRRGLEREGSHIECLSAITLATHDIGRAVGFYEDLGFELVKGGREAGFTTFRAGAQFLNITAEAPHRIWNWWGRAIFYVTDVDSTYRQAVNRGIVPDFAPRNAHWGERFFHLTDPDGHEISFARPLLER